MFIAFGCVNELPKIADDKGSKVPREESSDSKPLCEKICEDSPRVLNHDRSGLSYLAFPNFGYRGIGRCRGHAITTQKMSILAKFKKQGGCDLEAQECIDGLIAATKNILKNNIATYIYGFNNLYEFSQVPQIKEFLHHQVKSYGHRYYASAVRIQNQQSEVREVNIFYELLDRVKSNQLPYVGVVGKLTGSHALLIYDHDFVDGREVLCARDPNIVLGYAENCQSYAYIEEDKIYYKRHDRDADLLSKFKLTTDEDKRLVIYQKSLYNQCVGYKSSKNLCRAK